jgi:hypothetical protein
MSVKYALFDLMAEIFDFDFIRDFHLLSTAEQNQMIENKTRTYPADKYYYIVIMPLLYCNFHKHPSFIYSSHTKIVLIHPYQDCPILRELRQKIIREREDNARIKRRWGWWTKKYLTDPSLAKLLNITPTKKKNETKRSYHLYIL